jgi:tetratricopeptide (TPR) repeat protein
VKAIQIKRIVLSVFSLAMFSVAGAQGSHTTRAANFYVQLRDWNRLLQYGSGWSEQRPRDARGWYYLGTAYLTGLQQPADAIKPLERAAQLKSDWKDAWDALGVAYLQMQRYADAARAFELAVKLAPADPSSWNHLASAYAGADRAEPAERALDAEQVEAAKWASNADWYALGNGYVQLGCYAKAVVAYQRAISLDERVAAAWNNLGVAEERLGNGRDALFHYQRAAALGDELGVSNVQRLQSTPEQVRRALAHAWQSDQPGQG